MSRQPYVRPVSKTTWYMRNGRYKRYMLREVTCLLVGFYCFLAIWGLAALADGTPESWNAFLASQQNGAMIVVHAVALVYFGAWRPWGVLAGSLLYGLVTATVTQWKTLQIVTGATASLTTMAPALLTVIALAIIARRSADAPAALTVPFSRGA